jgi:hypothetical protein
MCPRLAGKEQQPEGQQHNDMTPVITHTSDRFPPTGLLQIDLDQQQQQQQ